MGATPGEIPGDTPGGMAGLLLAAGGGSRLGRTKALVTRGDGLSFVEHGVRVLRSGGCAPVVVVVGAEAESVGRLAERSGADLVVEAADWSSGQSASLRAGLHAVTDTEASAACVLLVDLPDVGADVVRRVTAAAGQGPGVLARAAYGRAPGHPVVIGRDHWADVAATVAGDAGARDYLAAHPHLLVQCGDLAAGHDVDTAADLA